MGLSNFEACERIMKGHEDVISRMPEINQQRLEAAKREHQARLLLEPIQLLKELAKLGKSNVDEAKKDLINHKYNFPLKSSEDYNTASLVLDAATSYGNDYYDDAPFDVLIKLNTDGNIETLQKVAGFSRLCGQGGTAVNEFLDIGSRLPILVVAETSSCEFFAAAVREAAEVQGIEILPIEFPGLPEDSSVIHSYVIQ